MKAIVAQWHKPMTVNTTVVSSITIQGNVQIFIHIIICFSIKKKFIYISSLCYNFNYNPVLFTLFPKANPVTEIKYFWTILLCKTLQQFSLYIFIKPWSFFVFLGHTWKYHVRTITQPTPEAVLQSIYFSRKRQHFRIYFLCGPVTVCDIIIYFYCKYSYETNDDDKR